MLKNIEIYVFLFFCYSIAGWIMESVGGIAVNKKFINRGFLIGPYCPVYGTGVVLVTLLLNNYVEDKIVLFILALVVCGSLEYFTGYIMEKIFNARWWDYSNHKFNINGRICLETLIPFGLIATVILCYVNPFLINIFNYIPEIIKHIIISILGVIFIIDCIVSYKIISSFKGEINANGDSTEQIGTKVKDKAEDVILKAESDVRLFGRKLKLKELKFERKVKYTGKKIEKKVVNKINTTKEGFVEKLAKGTEIFNNQIKVKKSEIEMKQKESKELLTSQIRKQKDNINNLQKVSKETITKTIENIKITSDEFTKQIVERFSKQSSYAKRLMDAFPTLRIKNKENKDNK